MVNTQYQYQYCQVAKDNTQYQYQYCQKAKVNTQYQYQYRVWGQYLNTNTRYCWCLFSTSEIIEQMWFYGEFSANLNQRQTGISVSYRKALFWYWYLVSVSVSVSIGGFSESRYQSRYRLGAFLSPGISPGID